MSKQWPSSPNEIQQSVSDWNLLSDEQREAYRNFVYTIDQPIKTLPSIRKRKSKKIPTTKYYSKEEWISLRQQVFERDGRLCYKCNCIATQVDHVLPKSKFPELAKSLDNLRPICWPCNSRKAARLV